MVAASKVLRRRRILDLKFMKNGVKKWVVEVDGKNFKCLNCGAVFEYSMYGRNLLIWSMNQHVTSLLAKLAEIHPETLSVITGFWTR